MDQPSDFNLTDRERQAYVMGYCRDNPGAQHRMEGNLPGLLRKLCTEFKVRREKYRNWEEESTQRPQPPDGLTTKMRAELEGPLDNRCVMREVHAWYHSGHTACLVMGNGEGKSIACASLLHGPKRALAPNKRGVFTPESTLISNIVSGTKKEKRESMQRFAADLLVVDFCGVGSAFGNSSYQASMDWCRERIESGKRTILTYKGSQQEFGMRYGAALSGSMMRICTIVEAR